LVSQPQISVKVMHGIINIETLTTKPSN